MNGAEGRPSLVDRLRTCAAEGLSQTQAAQLLGIGRAVVCRYAKKHDLAFTSGFALRTEAKRKQCAACAAEGLTTAETARRLGVTDGAVWTRAKQHGIVFAKKSAVRRNAYASCAAEGLTKAETARRLGMSKAAISIAAKRFGLSFAQGRPGTVKRSSQTSVAAGIS